ncbi:hypothetical protein EV138_2835 [Kribbella voronezhensis]|uniref:Lipoprotein n=1 Tax=Kribbella voronezhensis TaxID=2512212 RepID=A0A4V3FK88_9ACTN|nr:hypothetical protein [Kribbella voronezhensis]TDU89273.1 hypothetical protein EV138_2835 [Kribbella voronezhensis]
MKMRAGLALTAGLVLVSGCGASGLETGAGTVEKKTAEAFLTTAESTWHRQVDDESNKNLSAEARCYFVTGADGNKSLGTVACGPLRRLGSAERQVWDVARIETTGADKPGLELPEDEPWKLSQVRPDNSELWRPDNKKAADDADALAAPPAPAAPAGLTEVSDKSQTLDLEPAGDKLVVPDGTLTLKGIATPETIGSGAEVRAPASGEKFIAAVFGTAPTMDPLTGRELVDPASGDAKAVATKWTVTVGGQQRPVDIFPDAAGSAVVPERTLIASVPKDAAEVLLTATNGPVVQTLSLATGKRTSTTAAAFYRTGTMATLNKSVPAKSITLGYSFRSKFSYSLGRAALMPWDPAAGWAPDGQTWIRVELKSSLEYTFLQYDKSWADPMLTATADGTSVGRSAGVNSPEADIIAIAVPAGARSIQLKAQPRLNFTSNSFSPHNSPKSGTAVYPPLTATATFN